MPNHETYTVVKDYKNIDRKAYQNKLRKSLAVKKLANVRRYAVFLVRKREYKVATVAGIIGVSRQTICEWLRKFDMGGKLGLEDRSRRPHNIHKLDPTIVESILKEREEHKCGCEKLAIILNDVSHMSVYRVLVRFGKIKKGKVIRRRWRFFERKHPNSMWQIDIKTISEKDSSYSVSMIDDHSRFIVNCELYDHVPTMEDILSQLEVAINEYGKPREILTDHGAQFYAMRGGVSSFDMALDGLGIKHILAAIRKPTTIGKVERWHRTLKDELLVRVESLYEFKRRLKDFVEYYNFKRPHFHYERIEVEENMWKRRKFWYIPADRFMPILTERGLA